MVLLCCYSVRAGEHMHQICFYGYRRLQEGETTSLTIAKEANYRGHNVLHHHWPTGSRLPLPVGRWRRCCRIKRTSIHCNHDEQTNNGRHIRLPDSRVELFKSGLNTTDSISSRVYEARHSTFVIIPQSNKRVHNYLTFHNLHMFCCLNICRRWHRATWLHKTLQNQLHPLDLYFMIRHSNVRTFQVPLFCCVAVDEIGHRPERIGPTTCWPRGTEALNNLGRTHVCLIDIQLAGWCISAAAEQVIIVGSHCVWSNHAICFWIVGAHLLKTLAHSPQRCRWGWWRRGWWRPCKPRENNCRSEVSRGGSLDFDVYQVLMINWQSWALNVFLYLDRILSFKEPSAIW